MTKKARRCFLQDAWKLAKSVICDPSMKVIVSTCSNAAVLKEMGFQPDLVIIDESAFGTEADSTVPLSLFADHIILSGDHKQLLPIVKCLHHAEYANQQGLPIFERVLRNGNVPLFCLKINYRMHEEIATLPGALSYGWLGCDPSTAVEEDVFRYFSHFWYSEDAEKWRNARQKSPFRSIKETKGIAKKTIRRLFFNTKGSRSAHPDESTSFVNYGNAMAIVEYVCVLLGHWSKVDPSKVNFKQLQPSSITVVTGYSEQKEVIERLLKMALTLLGWNEFPSVVTIDSIQGGQNDVIVLDITAANEHHGSFIGFIGKWNRTNVAITRAKKILSIFGNLDSWRSELYNIVEINKHRKFGYLCMDVLDGDVIDVTPMSVERIPATAEEFVMDPSNWSIEMPHMDPKECKLKAKVDKIAKIYKTSPKEREKYEKNLWANLQAILKQRDALEKDFKANKEVATDLFQDPVGETMDIVLEKVGGDEGKPKPGLDLPSTRSEAIEGPIGPEQENEDGEDDIDLDAAMAGEEGADRFYDVEDERNIQAQEDIADQIAKDAALAHQAYLLKASETDAMSDDDEPPKDPEKEALRKSDDRPDNQRLGAARPQETEPSPFVAKGKYRHPHQGEGDLPDRSLEQSDNPRQGTSTNDERKGKRHGGNNRGGNRGRGGAGAGRGRGRGEPRGGGRGGRGG